MKWVYLFGFALLAGCQYVTPGKLSSVQTTSLHPRAGNVYLVRGWIGIFSTGIDSLGDQLNDHGVRAVVYQDVQWSALADRIAQKYHAAGQDAEPLVLIGHSYGADDVVRISRRLNDAHLTVDLLVTLDPVIPPQVPPNVKHCLNLYQSNGVLDYLPFLRGVPLTSQDELPEQIANGNLRNNRKDLLEPWTNHFTIDKEQKVHNEIIRLVTDVCPPRQQWAAARGVPANPAVASQAQQAGALLHPSSPAQISEGGNETATPPRGN